MSSLLASGIWICYIAAEMTLRIAIPNKGRLNEEAVDILRAISLRIPHHPRRSLMVHADGGNVQVLYTRAQDIPEFVELGAADLGITGLDLVAESGCEVERLHDFTFGTCKLVVAAPDNSSITNPDEIPARAKVATSYPNIVSRYFSDRKKEVIVVPISGAAEITPSIGVADLIVDITQTGATMQQNHLSLIDVIMDSHAIFIGNPTSVRRQKAEVDKIVSAFGSVQAASKKRYVMANVDRANLQKVEELLPGLAGATVLDLAVEDRFAVHAVVREDELNTILSDLKGAGASGILVLPIERLIP